MMMTLGTSLALACVGVLLAGCGTGSSSPRATDGSTSPSPSGSAQGATTIAVLSQTAGGGQVDLHARPLDTPDQVRAFTQPLMQRGLGSRIRKALAKADVPDGAHVYGAIVSIGCDVPPGVSVVRTDEGVQIVPHEVASPRPECLAPVTTVGLVALNG